MGFMSEKAESSLAEFSFAFSFLVTLTITQMPGNDKTRESGLAFHAFDGCSTAAIRHALCGWQHEKTVPFARDGPGIRFTGEWNYLA